jgi:hypothetical protein
MTLVKQLEVKHLTVDHVNKATGSRTIKMQCGSGEAEYDTVREVGIHYNLLVSEKHPDTNQENLPFY